MKRVLTAAQMKAADTAAIENGVPSLVLMERAALSVVQVLLHRKNEYDLSRCVIFCGTGNNAGDGVAIGRILKDYGYDARIVLVGNPEKYSEAMAQQVIAAENRKVRMVSYADLKPAMITHATLIIDAIFGIGLTRDIKGTYAEAIECMNSAHAPKIAVDIASGIHTDTGAVMGCAVKCNMTVTFARAKRGMLLFPGAAYSGQVVVKEIGIPVDDFINQEKLRTEDTSVTKEDLIIPQNTVSISENPDNNSAKDFLYQLVPEDLSFLPPRNESGNKGTFKKNLIIAGSKNIFGASALCAEAALRSGAGMVKVYTEESNRSPLCARVPEVLLSLYEESNWKFKKNLQQLESDLEWADGVVIGPGLGTSRTAEKILEAVINWNCKNKKLPVVFDADALNLLAKNPELLNMISFPAVFTPHMGEMSRLTGKSIGELKADPIKSAQAFSASLANTVSDRASITMVMKDARTIIATAEGVTYINTCGNSALATAGSGDVLAGIMGTLFTQNPDQTEIPALAVMIHGLTGERAAEKGSKAGVIASDLVKELPGIFS